MSKVRILQDIFMRNADNILFVDARTEVETTYGQLYDESLRAASFLNELGISKGEFVAFSMDNCPELGTLYLACMHLGGRILPINPNLHPREFIDILTEINVHHIFVSATVRANIGDALEKIDGLETHCFKPAFESARRDRNGMVTFDMRETVRTHCQTASSVADNHEDDVFLTIFSSGTTARSKGINRAYGDMLGNGLAFARAMGIGPENRFYNVLPMTYLGGFYNLFLIPLLAEGSLVIDNPFGMATLYGFWERTARHGVNTLWFNPTMMSMLLSLNWEHEEISFVPRQIRLALCGMAPLSPELKNRFQNVFGFPLHENYGLSETTFITTQRPEVTSVSGSQGAPLEHVLVEIVNNELQPLPSGSVGQVKVKTPYLMAGYESCAEEDLGSFLDDETFLTGDLGRMEEDGTLTITGRIKDIIIRGGINISPKAIEDTVYALPQVEEAAVIGISHSIYGQEVALAVKLRPGPENNLTVENLKAHCEKHIANFQRPKFIYLIDEMPKGVTGKIHKNVLTKLMEEKINPLGI
jgi:acyl-CoA synthetase (AMP-forming)/AMP-acid ligase II